MNTTASNLAARPRWKRVVLKLSGEALGEPGRGGIDVDVVHQLAVEIHDVCQNLGVAVAVVPGGGNLWRGARGAAEGMDHTQSDHIGMLGTVMNALALQDALERLGQDTRVQSALEMPRVAEAYIRRRAMRHLDKGRVVIFAAGTGNPFFTTDTAAALRAAEIDAEVILKGTHSGVEGVYNADPKKDPDAVRYDHVSFAEVMAKDLKVMDSTAIAFCRDNEIPIVVFDLLQPGNLRSILEGKPIGTLVG
ncbi:MAG: UMP kinase [Actinobacteria bacterium]|uniref:Uridylate kinase n=1 Tax=freshwater metagenome TaxID=449393 RepID=A0A6J6Q6E6_9ZZZZ|nr:UMP kinase [Actinomycetota bacterium]MSZ04307.1 UMP kinase [Actinomycetota bacterium]